VVVDWWPAARRIRLARRCISWHLATTCSFTIDNRAKKRRNRELHAAGPRTCQVRSEGGLDLDRRRGLPVTTATGAAPPLGRQKLDDRARARCGRSLRETGTTVAATCCGSCTTTTCTSASMNRRARPPSPRFRPMPPPPATRALSSGCTPPYGPPCP
jgi:hypothetical protein